MLSSLKAFIGSKGNVLLLAGLMLLPGTVLGAQYGFYAGVPTLEIGERWDYETHTQGRVKVPRVEMNMRAMDGEPRSASAPPPVSVSNTWEEVPIDERGSMAFRVIDTASEVAGIPTYRLWTRSDGSSSEIEVTRADLNPIVLKSVRTMNGKTTEVQAAEEFPLFRFPLHAGKRWTHDVPDEKVVVTFTVLDRDFRTFKGSPIEAYHIRGSVALDEQAFREAQEDGLERAHFALDYWYAPAVHGLLEIVFAMEISVRDGFSMNLRHAVTLVDHGSDPHSPEEIEVLRHGLAVSGPSELNLAETQESRHKLTLADGRPLPDGLDVAWFLDGKRVGARGAEAAITFEEVGFHVVEAAVESREGVFMSATQGIATRYAKSFDAPASVIGTKATFEFPVGTLPAHLRVQYKPATCFAVCAPQDGEVKLLDGEDNAITPNGGAGRWEIDTSEFTSGTWKVVLDIGPGRFIVGDHVVDVAQAPAATPMQVAADRAPQRSLLAETLGWRASIPRATAHEGIVPGALAALGVDG